MDTRNKIRKSILSVTTILYSSKQNYNTWVIFNNVFGYLGSSDLQTCRFICKKWEEIANPLFAEKANVCLSSIEMIESFVKRFHTKPTFYRNFIIEGDFEMKGYASQFFSVFGRSIKTLQIRNWIWMGKTLFYIMETTPNLESLTLIGQVFLEDRIYPPGWEFLDDQSQRIHWRNVRSLTLDLEGYTEDIKAICPKSHAGNIQPFLYQVFLATPNIEELHYPHRDQFFCKVLLHTVLFKDEIKLGKLQRFEIQSKVTDFELKFMLRKSLTLVSFTLVVQPNVSLHTLHTLLTHLGSTLRVLNLRYVEREAVSSQYFPSSLFLTKVKELTLCKFNGSLIFLHDLTSLEKLIVKDGYLQTLFSGPKGEPVIWPVGFVFDKSEISNGIVRGCRDKLFIC